MGLHPMIAFGAGELDPALRKRVNLDKYRTGLATLRNAFIGKTGRIVSRQGTSKYKVTKDNPTMTAKAFTRATANLLDCHDHNLGTGTLVRLTTTGTLPGGLSTGTDYYAIRWNRDAFGLATSLANAKAHVFVTTSSAGVGTHTFVPTALGSGYKSIIYSPPFSKYLIEWGHRYVRIHNTEDGTYAESGQDFTEDDLPYVKFVPSGLFVYIFCRGYLVQKMTLGDLLPSSTGPTYNRILPAFDIFWNPGPPLATSESATGAPAGYDVEYAITQVTNGIESDWGTATGVAWKLPIAAGQSNNIGYTGLASSGYYITTEIRVYRRPKNGQAFGYIGAVAVLGGVANFVDYGQEADYTHSPPTPTVHPYIWYVTPQTYQQNTGTVYQQRLIITDARNDEAIYASRTGHQDNFWRDYPLAADSGLQFKTGVEGNAKILHLAEADGLLAFTTRGIFKSTGPLTPDNLAMQDAGSWVIKETLPPLKVPGALLFVDTETNTIRTLIYSNEAQGYPGDEISIFSNHLFETKEIVSWAYEPGDTPLIWCVMSDGTINCLTYQRDQLMRAWSHMDTFGGNFESVAVVKRAGHKSEVYFVVERNGTRYIELAGDRFTPDFKDQALVDAGVTVKHELEDSFVATAQDITDWYGLINIAGSNGLFNNVAGEGAVGTIFRMFDDEGSVIDLEVVTRTDSNNIVVQPMYDQEFPSDQTTGFSLYRTYTEVSGLDHLEGQLVSILVDGNVVASPLNDVEDYPEFRVNGGKITLPVRNDEQMRGAFIHVGLPIVSDFETLDVSTIEQKPTMTEDMIVSRLEISVYRTRGLFLGSQFPDNNFVKGMTSPEEREENINTGNIGNAAQEPVTKDYKLSIPNDWNSRGRICGRQVDPLPYEILAFIPDINFS